PGRVRNCMDVAREGISEKKKRRRVALVVAGVTVVSLATFGLSRVRPAAPPVDASTLWTDTVQRGPMLRQVRGTGTLVPEETRWIPAVTEGRVERILLQAGTPVEADSVILELSDPAQIQNALDAQLQLRAAEAEMESLKATLQSQHLDQMAATARLKAEYEQAKLRADSDEELGRQGLMPEISRKLSRSAADELNGRYELDRQRLAIGQRSIQSQVAAQQARIEGLRTMSQLQRSRVDALQVRAGIRGVLQQVSVEVGQRVTPGASLARIVQPEKLKAELRIAETQARDIQIGERAEIDTRNGVVPGIVSRIDPSVREGTVSVDVRMQGELPRGARPDLTVDGTVELERLASIIYVKRPVHARESSAGTIFKLTADGEAVRVPVKYGRSSVSTIEVVEGLAPGDKVILSDMSAWDEFDRLKLH
ncbi:MAG: HlyD family efflux transporter periplasmic adaptor subunit, partial [Acidobacteriota bacterium]